MKKALFILTAFLVIIPIINNAQAEDYVKIEIPASSVDNIDVKYQKEETAATKALDATKEATNKTIKSTKKVTKKTVKATKNFTKKTVEATKELTNKTVDSTKEVIDNLNPNKPVTFEELQAQSDIKILKSERNQKKSAYNSRIKDLNAQIKAAENSTLLNEVQKQNKVYTLNKEKAALIYQRDKEINDYNLRIDRIKQKNK